MWMPDDQDVAVLKSSLLVTMGRHVHGQDCGEGLEPRTRLTTFAVVQYVHVRRRSAGCSLAGFSACYATESQWLESWKDNRPTHTCCSGLDLQDTG